LTVGKPRAEQTSDATSPGRYGGWYNQGMEDAPDVLSHRTPPHEPVPSDRLLGRAHTLNRRKRTARMLMILGWVIAAGLLILAPFQAVFGILGLESRGGSVDGQDGWGRSRAFSSADGTNVGIALWACAAGCAVLAILAGRSLLRPEAALRLWTTTLTAVGVVCVLAGVFASLTLEVQSYGRRITGVPGGAASNLRTEWGLCMWLTLAALVISGASTLSLLRSIAPSSFGYPENA
jgi:hypothetical protein